MRVLVTDGQLRSALVAVRSLARAGHRVAVAESTWCTTGFFSRHPYRRAVYPSPAADPEAFAGWVAGFCRREGIDVVLPIDDATTGALAGRGLPCASLLPRAQAFGVFRDKRATVAAAEATGIPVPATVDDPADADGIGYPLVVKPRWSSGGRGLRRVDRPQDLAAVVRQATAACGPVMLQRWVPPGRQYDVGLLYDRQGRQAAGFVQLELRHYPIEGGPSTLQESVHRPDLLALAARLVETVGWVGPVEVEFRCDEQTGTPWLMEVNPRLWASLGLAVRAGVDFPALAVRLAAGAAAATAPDYAAGLRCRWLLPGDILHYLANPQRSSMQPPFWSTYDGRTTDDILSWEDPGPALGVGIAALRYLALPQLRRSVLRPPSTPAGPGVVRR